MAEDTEVNPYNAAVIDVVAQVYPPTLVLSAERRAGEKRGVGEEPSKESMGLAPVADFGAPSSESSEEHAWSDKKSVKFPEIVVDLLYAPDHTRWPIATVVFRGTEKGREDIR